MEHLTEREDIFATIYAFAFILLGVAACIILSTMN